ncbi:MAG: [FeFe] hydrogenase H-cluster maturation GTPase HydF [Clostridiales bacterium]|nr:[FeFe] hydrogenase H-cluster maturation GTPase HydF [Clostridiales bacterium]
MTNDTPSANRLHIGIFGRTNSGKSSFINALTHQQVSIVSDIAGTTTDPVYKAMEIHPLGACTIIDTAGFDDVTELGEKRLEKTRLAAEKTDVAIIILSADEEEGDEEKALEWNKYFRGRGTPVLFIVNKSDVDAENAKNISARINKATGEEPLLISATGGEGMDAAKEALIRKVPENFGDRQITGELVHEGDFVLLVMPQDIQAPKGRLILPQVQTMRELLDKKCVVLSVTTDKIDDALSLASRPPKLIITDSQAFDVVYKKKPAESLLTSFSVLFAAYKGDLPYYVEGAKAIDSLNEKSNVLIAECCTHAPLSEDIGREKIPRMLRKRYGQGLSVNVVSGTDFPANLSGYDLIIQCGACMFNRSYVMSRIGRAREQKIPMTNYGVTIAHLTGILDQVSLPGVNA